jgi:hypothetical protein
MVGLFFTLRISVIVHPASTCVPEKKVLDITFAM